MEATKFVWGWSTGCLRRGYRSWICSPWKRWLQGDLINSSRYPVRRCKEDRDRFLSRVVQRNEQTLVGTWEILTKGKESFFHCGGDQMWQEQHREAVGSLYLEMLRAALNYPKPPALIGPALSRGWGCWPLKIPSYPHYDSGGISLATLCNWERPNSLHYGPNVVLSKPSSIVTSFDYLIYLWLANKVFLYVQSFELAYSYSESSFLFSNYLYFTITWMYIYRKTLSLTCSFQKLIITTFIL